MRILASRYRKLLGSGMRFQERYRFYQSSMDKFDEIFLMQDTLNKRIGEY